MELVRNIVRVGNSAGVILPKDWYGGQAKVVLMQKPISIKKDVLEILSPYLESILGIYLVGSYARNEQTSDSDVDVIAISKNLKKEIISGKYHISVYTLESIEKTLQDNAITIAPRLLEARPILNTSLLDALKQLITKKFVFSKYLEETKRVIKINHGLLKLDQEQATPASESIVYSLILRLRGIFIIKTILRKEKYSTRLFLKWLEKANMSRKEAIILYNVYKAIRDNQKIKETVRVDLAEKLLRFVEKEMENVK
jgi:predicted nucleotidyltransferase